MFFSLVEYLCEKFSCSPDQLIDHLEPKKDEILKDLAEAKLYVSFAELTMFRAYPMDFSIGSAELASVSKCHFKGPLIEYYSKIFHYEVKHPNLPCLIITRWENDERREQYPLECVKIIKK